jgi:L-ascorbate oxidase
MRFRSAWHGFILACVAGCNGVSITAHSGPPAMPAPDELREPPAISSVDGVLDLLMIARSAAIAQFSPYETAGQVYEICRRPTYGAAQCPADTAHDNDYGGTRLQVSAGDVLRIHLVNRLGTNPVLRTGGAEDDFLKLNPTNIHLHGMLVSPRYSTADDPTWGDNVFVYNFNSANGPPSPGSNLHGTVIFDAVDYKIPIPLGHPSGLFWFHPHIHGISQDQITAGLSGIITVGEVADYICSGASWCDSSRAPPDSRHLIIKDSQVLADGSVQYKLRSDFCSYPGPPAGAMTAAAPGQGACEGVDRSGMGGGNFSGGRWYFTINGQQYPSISIGAPAGQILRIVNASASTTYDLNLWNAEERRQMPMQVISIDGASVDYGATNCVGVTGAQGLCTTLLHLMPSSRAEVWVTYRDAHGAVTAPPRGAGAILRTNGFNAGPRGDSWPAVDLAKVRFQPGTTSNAQASAAPEPRIAQSDKIAGSLRSANTDVPADPNCTALPSGHKRRIFFNSPPPSANSGGLGLGYEEVDENDNPVPGTFIDVAQFDPTTPTICLPLASGNLPATEQWELVNLSGSDHNFHLHQAHFLAVTAADLDDTWVPPQVQGRQVSMDSLPLQHADGECLTVADWRNGLCTAHISTIEITFSIAGDFVYHCHILAHEDVGMMAVIRVRPDAASANPGIVNSMLSALGVAPGAPRQPATRRPLGFICKTPRRIEEGR